MRFMLILKSNKDSEAGKMPSEESIAAMVKYNQSRPKREFDRCGGSVPQFQGARIRFSTGGKKTVIDGPFTESKELVGGYWIIEGEVARRSDRMGEAISGGTERSGSGDPG